MSEMKFQGKVMTPNGEGLVQGRLKEKVDGKYVMTRIIVSHAAGTQVAEEHRLTITSRPGIWTLAAYLPEELRAM